MGMPADLGPWLLVLGSLALLAIVAAHLHPLTRPLAVQYRWQVAAAALGVAAAGLALARRRTADGKVEAPPAVAEAREWAAARASEAKADRLGAQAARKAQSVKQQLKVAELRSIRDPHERVRAVQRWLDEREGE